MPSIRRPEPAEEGSTPRGQERGQEDVEFVPVIIKRTDATKRHPDDILEAAIKEGTEQLERSPVSLGLSAVAAGLILGFTAMSVSVASTLLGQDPSPATARLGIALVYPLGFVLCLMSGTELFTEHTAIAVYPVLEQRVRWPLLLRLWVIVAAGNLVGAFASAGLLASADAVIGARAGYLAQVNHLVSFSPGELLLSALLAGWLMALGGWLIRATPPAIGQMVSIYLVTFLIGLGQLHHSIAGSGELFAAILVGGAGVTAGQSLTFIAVALMGNLLGGSLFVAILNYGHIRTTQSAA